MNLIIDFYKELDTLNLIIFWGIIIVIILLLIFSFILINKNKKLKKIVENQLKYEEEIPIKKQELIETTDEESIILKEKEEPKEEIIPIEIEKKFIVEEHISEFQTDKKIPVEENKTKEEKKYHQINNIEIPNKPYQRNVLREMSLSQTSPIGINRPNIKEDKKKEMIQDLEESLNNKNNDAEIKIEIPKQNTNIETTSSINIKDKYNEQKEIKNNNSINKGIEVVKKNNNEVKMPTHTSILENYQDIPKDARETKEKKSSEKYLEEVSRKLAEAEVPDEIERTNYEIKQEEDAIISYKELMEKKDSIQTIDEEEAVISIEELMNRANQKTQESPEESSSETKLYNLSEEEANDNFIKELKQFRNDL